MKKSDDGTYLSDSVYKVFGYLHDFSAAWVTDQVTRALLLVPDDVSAVAGVSGEMVVATPDDEDALAAALDSALLG
jgi:hypothetical protein